MGLIDCGTGKKSSEFAQNSLEQLPATQFRISIMRCHRIFTVHINNYQHNSGVSVKQSERWCRPTERVN